MKSYLKIPKEVLNAMEINTNLRPLESRVNENAAQLIYLSSKSLDDGRSTVTLECGNKTTDWSSMYGTKCLLKSQDHKIFVKAFTSVLVH